ncbi:Sec-independent protein translocase protein TatB [Luteimonas sp. FXH3W]|uniref:Sec-independent protein translocase protein TatB n=1 Tax=Aquilutibacter rugosus TaxID=3115820 RepID=A0ABU7UX60_9GAMM
MFDVGFSEILLTLLVALVVLGPRRLPTAARYVGLMVRKARAQWFAVKAEFEQELAAEDLKRSLRETQQALRDAEDEIRRGADSVQREVTEHRDER